MRTRMLSATAASNVPPFYMADGVHSRERLRSRRRKHKISRFTLAARAQIRESMASMINHAKRQGLVLYLPCQQRAFDPVELQKEMAAGRYCWGPRWFQLREVH